MVSSSSPALKSFRKNEVDTETKDSSNTVNRKITTTTKKPKRLKTTKINFGSFKKFTGVMRQLENYHWPNGIVFKLIILMLMFVHQSNCETTPILGYNPFNNGTQKLVKRQTAKPDGSFKLQRFLVEPEDMTVNIGESVLLPCRVSNKAGTVQWTRDGFGLGADSRLEGFPTYSMMHNDATGDYSLKISTVSLDDDAVFQCQVGALDNVPGIRSQSAKLTVQVRPDEPVIVMGHIGGGPSSGSTTSQDVPQVLSTTAGTRIELTCEAHGGRPAAELSWLNSKNRVVQKGITSKITPMNDKKRFNAALKWVFEPTKTDHQKRLYCQSSHPTMGSNTSTVSIMLEVKYPPEVKLEVIRIPSTNQQPQQATMVAGSSNSLTVFGTNTFLHGRIGDTIKLKCIADGNPGKEHLTFEWFRQGELISGDHGNELVFDNIDKSFNGAEINCKVTNPVGTGTAKVTLNIAYGPSFLPSMRYVYGVNQGESTKLECAVDSNPAPDITWIKVGTSSVLSSGSKLTIRNANRQHVGEYLCRVSVKGFSEISAIVYLRLNGPPKIRKSKPYNNHFYAVMGEPGHIECLMESVPSPIAVTWIHNGQIFTSGSHNNIPMNIDIHEENLKEEPVALKASFDIQATMPHDYGYYNCVVVNSFGSDWHMVSLKEQTSFSTIVIMVSISISILVFIVLTTIVLLLAVKHRKLIRKQNEQEQEKHVDNKEHYITSSEDSVNHNIYSTSSTRTNSSTDKNGHMETGTIITRSGSTGSPRSSTSSFPAYLDSSNRDRNSPNRLITNGKPGHHHHHHLSNRSTHHHHHHHPVTGTFPDPSQSPSFFNTAMYDPTDESLSTTIPMSQTGATEVVAMPPINSAPYSSITRHLMHHKTALHQPPSYLSSSAGSYQQYLRNSIALPGLEPGNDMYQASLYQVMPSNRVKSPLGMPTPTPSLTKELDDCISKNSIATHV